MINIYIYIITLHYTHRLFKYMSIPFENISGDNVNSNMRHIMEPTIIEIKRIT